jgi:hypothetical protein
MKSSNNVKSFKEFNENLNISDVSYSLEEEIKKLKDIGVSFNEEMLRKRIEEFKDMNISELEKKTRNIQHYGSNIHYAAKILISLKK